MYRAELHGKLLAETEGKEDILTSNVLWTLTRSCKFDLLGVCSH